MGADGSRMADTDMVGVDPWWTWGTLACWKGKAEIKMASPNSLKRNQSAKSVRDSNVTLSRATTYPMVKSAMQRQKKMFQPRHSEEITTISESKPSRANYNVVREQLLKWTPSSYHCRLFCGGTACKYCDPNGFPIELQAVPGLFSTWVTDDILASSRPTADAIERFDLFNAFKSRKIVSVINLQRPYEHMQCGPPFPPKLEFAYDPEHFMRENFFHYNFGWPDFGASTVACLLDMVKVLAFALTQGKVAIHCHAGLGRTGVLICAFLMWEKNYTPTDAIQLVRNRRPGSVQTTPQVDLLLEFDDFLKTLKPIFDSNLTLVQYLKQQQVTLHGVEARVLKHIPKIVFVCCERLLELAEINENGDLKDRLKKNCTVTRSPLGNAQLVPLEVDIENEVNKSSAVQEAISEGPYLLVKEFQNSTQVDTVEQGQSKEEKLEKWKNVLEMLLKGEVTTNDEILKIKAALDTKGFPSRWDTLANEKSIENLLFLLHDWFMSLKDPAIPSNFSINSTSSEIDNLPKCSKRTLLYCASVLGQIAGKDSELKNLLAQYLRICFSKNRKKDEDTTGDHWYMATIECVQEMDNAKL